MNSDFYLKYLLNLVIMEQIYYYDCEVYCLLIKYSTF